MAGFSEETDFPQSRLKHTFTDNDRSQRETLHARRCSAISNSRENVQQFQLHTSHGLIIVQTQWQSSA